MSESDLESRLAATFKEEQEKVYTNNEGNNMVLALSQFR